MLLLETQTGAVWSEIVPSEDAGLSMRPAIVRETVLEMQSERGTCSIPFTSNASM